ncbi:MAG: DUF4388 domain-containing protein, partial [Thermodesulfobacteriota bacterium]
SEAISASFLGRIKESKKFQLIDQEEYIIKNKLFPVFVLQDYEKIKYLYDNIEKALNGIDFEQHYSQPDETGTLENTFFPRLLKQIESEKRTGLLILSSNFETKIYFREGAPVYCQGSNLNTALVRILLKENKINSDQYNEIIKDIDEKQEGQKIGEILISKGYISPHDLNKCLELQIKEKIIAGFLLTKGQYSFEYNIDVPDEIYPTKFEVNDIIYEGIKRYIDITGLNSKNLKLIISPTLSKKTNNMNLGPKELRAIQMLSKKQPVSEIIENGRMEKEKVLKLIYFLAFNNLIELEGLSVDSIGKASLNKVNSTLTKVNLIEKEMEKPPRENILVLDEASILTEEIILEEDLQIDKLSETDQIFKQTENGSSDLDNEKIELDVTTLDIKPDKIELEEEKPLQIDTEEPKPQNKAEKKEMVNQDIINEIDEVYEKLGDDFYSLLKVDENAKSDEIKNSYLNLAKKFHPDKILNYPEKSRNKAEEIFSSLTLAFETLLDQNSRSTYDSRTELNDLKGKAGSIYEAEVRFNEGEAHLRQRNYINAEKKFKEAVDLNPEESAYLGAYGWAKYYASGSKETVSKEAITIIEKAISIDPGCAKNYYYLGALYKINNNLLKSEKNFEKALEIDKTLIEAKRELRLIVNRKIERRSDKANALKGKGIEKRFWSGLFKK